MTPDEIRNFWKSHPYANIALKTDKFFVIDIDRHKDGADGVAEIKKLGHTDWFHDTLAQRTAHNGFQYFFKSRPMSRYSRTSLSCRELISRLMSTTML